MGKPENFEDFVRDVFRDRNGNTIVLPDGLKYEQDAKGGVTYLLPGHKIMPESAKVFWFLNTILVNSEQCHYISSTQYRRLDWLILRHEEIACIGQVLDTLKLGTSELATPVLYNFTEALRVKPVALNNGRIFYCEDERYPYLAWIRGTSGWFATRQEAEDWQNRVATDLFFVRAEAAINE